MEHALFVYKDVSGESLSVISVVLETQLSPVRAAYVVDASSSSWVTGFAVQAEALSLAVENQQVLDSALWSGALVGPAGPVPESVIPSGGEKVCLATGVSLALKGFVAGGVGQLEGSKQWSQLFQQNRRENLKLSYIKSVVVDGESVAVVPEEVLDAGAKDLGFALFGICVGKKVPFKALLLVLSRKWVKAGTFSIHTVENGIYVFKYASKEVRDWILDNGPWDVWGAHLALRLWERDTLPRQCSFSKVPVWVKLVNILLEFWTPCGLSHLARVLGKPMHIDAATRNRQIINFARVYVEMEAVSKFLGYIRARRADGRVVDVKVEYCWKPVVCDLCRVSDHSTRACPVQAYKDQVSAKMKEKERNVSNVALEAEGWVTRRIKGKEKVHRGHSPKDNPLGPSCDGVLLPAS
ncbi:DUF4283 domain-containing protein [Cephalotus follicularis]|uniref:DUF4283 domain-containing protein n=1 Tax=Cephalotus follicularis TaxID=3775 RepID=A0A1Q3C6F5_CEPFO|nr:DUF4283 domain-containing protein [Cephalotus follicularis]